MVADVRRLLDEEGLSGVPLMAVSAREGDGMAELKAEVVKRVAAKKSSRARVEADVKAAAGRLEEESGTAAPRELSKERVAALEDAFADAAGVPDRHRGRREVGPHPRPAGDRVAGDPGLLDVPSRSAQAARPRPRLRRQAPVGARPEVGAGADAGGEGPGRRRGPGARRRRLRRADPPVGHVGPRGGVVAACPTWPAGSTARSPAPTWASRRSRGGPGWCGCCSGC